MNEKISKITIETNDPTLVVDINKKNPTVSIMIYTVGISIILVEAIYLLFLAW